MFLTETWLTSDIPETEIFLGNNIKVVNRNERESGEHGGLLTASSLSLFHKIVNLSIMRYYFSGGCVIIDDHCLNCFIAIYNPQTPKFQVALPTLSNCLHEYYKIFTSFREKRGTNIPYVIYVLVILTFLRLIGLTYLLVSLLTWNFWIWLPILD